MTQDNNSLKHWNLYVLKLEHDKYYVGITTKTAEKRFREHKNNFLAAAWTKEHPPIAIFDSKDLGLVTKKQAESYENKVVRKYINKYGIGNVRGGDISITENLIKLFGWYYSKEMLITVVVILFFMFVITYLLLVTLIK